MVKLPKIMKNKVIIKAERGLYGIDEEENLIQRFDLLAEFDYLLYFRDKKYIVRINKAYIIEPYFKKIKLLQVTSYDRVKYLNTGYGSLHPAIDRGEKAFLEIKQKAGINKKIIEYKATVDSPFIYGDSIYLKDMELYRESLYNMRKIII